MLQLCMEFAWQTWFKPQWEVIDICWVNDDKFLYLPFSQKCQPTRKHGRERVRKSVFGEHETHFKQEFEASRTFAVDCARRKELPGSCKSADSHSPVLPRPEALVFSGLRSHHSWSWRFLSPYLTSKRVSKVIPYFYFSRPWFSTFSLPELNRENSWEWQRHCSDMIWEPGTSKGAAWLRWDAAMSQSLCVIIYKREIMTLLIS